MCLLPFLYGSIYEGDWRWDSERRLLFPIPSHFLQNTREKMYFERNVKREAEWVWPRILGNLFFFFNSSSQFLLSPALCLSRLYKIHLYCHIHRMRWWSPDSHMHTYLTENINAFHVFGGSLEIWRWMFHVETSSFLVSQVFRNKARLPESHAELNGWWEEEHKKWDVGLQLKTFWITAIIFSYLF